MGRLAKIFDPNLRIYSLLLLKVALLRYRPSLATAQPRYRIYSCRPFQIPIPY